MSAFCIRDFISTKRYLDQSLALLFLPVAISLASAIADCVGLKNSNNACHTADFE